MNESSSRRPASAHASVCSVDAGLGWASFRRLLLRVMTTNAKIMMSRMLRIANIMVSDDARRYASLGIALVLVWAMMHQAHELIERTADWRSVAIIPSIVRAKLALGC